MASDLRFRRSEAIFLGGRYWVRTSDLFGVNEARYHCANRPGARVPGCVLSVLGAAVLDLAVEMMRGNLSAAHPWHGRHPPEPDRPAPRRSVECKRRHIPVRT